MLFYKLSLNLKTLGAIKDIKVELFFSQPIALFPTHLLRALMLARG